MHIHPDVRNVLPPSSLSAPVPLRPRIHSLIFTSWQSDPDRVKHIYFLGS